MRLVWSSLTDVAVRIVGRGGSGSQLKKLNIDYYY